MAEDNRLRECIHNNSFECIIVVLLGKLDKLGVVHQDIHMGRVTLWDIMVAYEKDRRSEEGLLFFEPIFINLIIEILQQIKNVILHERAIILVLPIYYVWLWLLFYFRLSLEILWHFSIHIEFPECLHDIFPIFI